MKSRKLVELTPFEFIYFDLDFSEDEFYGRLPPSIYPGAKDTDNRLTLSFDEDTGEVLSVYSFDIRAPEQKTELDLRYIHPLDIQHMYEAVYIPFKHQEVKYSKEVLDYLISNRRISRKFYEQELGRHDQTQSRESK